MPSRLMGAGAFALGIILFGAGPLSAQSTDSIPATHVLAAVIVNAPLSRDARASVVENRRLRRDLAHYDARIVALEVQLDRLRTVADSLDRDRLYFEAAAAHARLRRERMEQRLRELEGRTVPTSDSTLATP
jgi:hypothetical protein